MVNYNTFLQQPITSLSCTVEFKRISALLGFDSLKQIVDTKEKTIMNKPEFTHLWFQELVSIMQEQDLLDLLEADNRF